MNPDEILQALVDEYDGVVLTEAWGERGVFYNPRETLARGTYFVTVKDHDGPNDTASALDREGVFRVNFGLSEETYRSLFGDPPVRPPKGGVVDTGHDFTALDELLPHPTYGWSHWVCVLNPSRETFAELRPHIDESYERAQAQFESRTR